LLAQIDGVVVLELRVLRLERDRALVVRLGLGLVVEPVIEHGGHEMRAPETRVLLDRAIDLLLRLLQVALAQMLDAELQVDLRGALGLRFGHVGVALASDQTQEADGHDRRCTLHGCTATEMSFEPRRTVVRSLTRPTNWPQAASMSSPRVRRVVAITPLLLRISRNRSIAAA